MNFRTFLCTSGVAGTFVLASSALAGGSDCCAPNGGIGCSDTECQDQICGADSFCCDVEWDQLCADAACAECEICVDDPACGGGGGACGPDSGDCLAPNGSPGCDDNCNGVPCEVENCCETVCAADSFCCDVEWDAICADAAAIQCQGPCDLECPPDSSDEGEPCGDDLNGGCNVPVGGDSDCCVANGSPGCDDAGCEKAVCAADSFCCETEWDGICADMALDLCPDVCFVGKPAFTPIECGETVCGTGWADNNFRDTDWFEIVIEENTELTFTGTAQFPLLIGLINTGGVPDCNLATAFQVSATSNPCESASFTVCVGPGTWWLFAAPNTFAGFPCGPTECPECPDFNGDGMVDGADLGLLLASWGPGGGCEDINGDGIVDGADLGLLLGAWGPCPLGGASTGANTYFVTVDCKGGCTPPACGNEDAGDCFDANGSPFCDNLCGGVPCDVDNCCETVCAGDPFCCDVEWDGICAGIAADLCFSCDLGPFEGTPEDEPCGDDLNGGCNVSFDSNCCVANGGVGCDDAGCEKLVCAADSFCCETAWDDICAGMALDLCGDLCTGAEMFGSIECGEIIAGSGWADNNLRDTDWFLFELEETSFVSATAIAEFPALIGFIDLNNGCEGATAFIASATAPKCEISQVGGDQSLCLDAGTYVLFIAPNAFAGYPCPGEGEDGENDYQIELTCDPTGTKACPSPCEGAEGSCFEANGTPGCDDIECCEIVCGADAFCCDVEWDQICADAAVQTCGVEPPANDTCDNAEEIFDGQVNFTTIGANTDGPELPIECDKGFGTPLTNDIWFTYTAPCTGVATFSTCDSADYDTRLAAYQGDCSSLDLVACNDDGIGCADFTSILEVEVVEGETYIIRVGGFNAAGSGALVVSCSG